jgi:ubiquinol-cytochrome c reductase cytochrome c subunit
MAMGEDRSVRRQTPPVRSHRRWSAAVLFVAPVVAAVVLTLVVPRASATARVAATDTSRAQSIYLRDCAVCHGADARGSVRGPTLFDAGRASVQYYLTTGRMPLSHPDAIPKRHRPRYSPEVIDELIEYIATLTDNTGPDIPQIDLANADVAAGGVLFRLNCAACHSWAGTGGALSDRQAPSLRDSTPQQIADAIRVGPGLMPSFGEAAISNAQLSDVVAAAHYAAHPKNRGGVPLAHLGPLAEGAVAVFAGLGLLLVFTLWIGTKRV